MSKLNNVIKNALDNKEYHVDQDGVVYKLIEFGKPITPRIVIPQLHQSNRYRIRVNGTKVMLHRVIAYLKFGDKAFEKDWEVHHIDNNPQNNHPSNLALITRGYHLKTLHAGE